MITSSITAQCYPPRIIHNVTYTLNPEIYSPFCPTAKVKFSTGRLGNNGSTRLFRAFALPTFSRTNFVEIYILIPLR